MPRHPRWSGLNSNKWATPPTGSFQCNLPAKKSGSVYAGDSGTNLGYSADEYIEPNSVWHISNIFPQSSTLFSATVRNSAETYYKSVARAGTKIILAANFAFSIVLLVRSNTVYRVLNMVAPTNFPGTCLEDQGLHHSEPFRPEPNQTNYTRSAALLTLWVLGGLTTAHNTCIF